MSSWSINRYIYTVCLCHAVRRTQTRPASSTTHAPWWPLLTTQQESPWPLRSSLSPPILERRNYDSMPAGTDDTVYISNKMYENSLYCQSLWFQSFSFCNVQESSFTLGKKLSLNCFGYIFVLFCWNSQSINKSSNIYISSEWRHAHRFNAVVFLRITYAY